MIFKTHAMDGVAVSGDGIVSEKYAKPIKPCVIFHNSVLYHIYCATRPTTEDEREKYGYEFRCLAIAALKSFEIKYVIAEGVAKSSK